MQAAIGCAQLDKFPDFVIKRRDNFDYLFKKLVEGGAENKLIMPVSEENSNPSWFGFIVTCRAGVERNKIVQYVESKGVQTRMLFAGNLTKHPCFDVMRKEKRGYRVVGELINTDRIMKDSFWVGIYPGMTISKLNYMAKVILEAIRL